MNDKHIHHTSKFLSYVLRHKPESIGLILDDQGWASVEELLGKDPQRQLTRELLEHIVATNDKKRFAFNEDKSRIRASQGHSIDVELQLEALEPPEYLYHGTVEKFLDAIRKEGLHKMSRQHVHLSAERATAEKVGSRRGKPYILLINAGRMHNDGILFYRSDNGVWLTEQVPPQYISEETA